MCSLDCCKPKRVECVWSSRSFHRAQSTAMSSKSTLLALWIRIYDNGHWPTPGKGATLCSHSITIWSQQHKIIWFKIVNMTGNIAVYLKWIFARMRILHLRTTSTKLNLPWVEDKGGIAKNTVRRWLWQVDRQVGLSTSSKTCPWCVGGFVAIEGSSSTFDRMTQETCGWWKTGPRSPSFKRQWEKSICEMYPITALTGSPGEQTQVTGSFFIREYGDASKNPKIASPWCIVYYTWFTPSTQTVKSVFCHIHVIHVFPPKDGGGLRDFYNSWTENCWKLQMHSSRVAWMTNSFK